MSRKLQTHSHYHHLTIPEVLEKTTKLLTNTTPYNIHSAEQTLPHRTRTTLAQLRANKSILLQSYLHTVNHETYMPQCPLCLSHTHDINHIFNCSQVPTQHNTTQRH